MTKIKNKQFNKYKHTYKQDSKQDSKHKYNHTGNDVKKSHPYSPKVKIQPQNYRIPQDNWDDFIRDFNGFDCQQLCQDGFPTQQTVNLFQNPASSMVFCRWCKS